MAGVLDFWGGNQPVLLSGQPRQGAVSAFSDPRTVGLLSLAAGLLQAGGPSRTPVSTGQAIGQGYLAGLGGYGQAQNALAQNAMRQAQMTTLEQQARKSKLDADLQQQLMGSGALSGMNDPDKLEQLGTRLAASGHAGGAALIAQAQRMRQQMEDRQTAESFKSRPGVLGAGVTTTSPQGQALLGNLTGDQSFDSAVLAAQNEALNSNTKLPAQPVQSPRPGLFAPLMASPYVGQFAQDMQSQIDASKGLKPTQILGQYDRLQQQHLTSANQATARGESAELRRELANQADNTRRMLAAQSVGARTDRQQDLQAQREFTRERSLANDYNDLSKDFRTVLPGFQASAQYLASGKYDSSGDRALIFSFARTLDPRDRVGVRDVTDINKLGNIPERMYQAIVGVAEGKMLPDRVRMDMFNVMRDRFQNMNELQQQFEDEYEKRAKTYMIRPDNVVTRHSIKRDKVPTGPATTRGASGTWSARPVP
jgi:hypothetical protein